MQEVYNAPTLFDWLVLLCAFISLLLSMVGLLFVISTRKRVKQITESVTAMFDNVKQLSSDATRSAKQAELSASAADNSARAAQQSSKASDRSAISAASISEAVQKSLLLGSGEKQD